MTRISISEIDLENLESEVRNLVQMNKMKECNEKYECMLKMCELIQSDLDRVKHHLQYKIDNDGKRIDVDLKG